MPCDGADITLGVRSDGRTQSRSDRDQDPRGLLGEVVCELCSEEYGWPPTCRVPTVSSAILNS